MIILSILVALDQVAKYFFKRLLQPYYIEYGIKGLMSFLYVENRGAAFGIFQGKAFFLILVPILSIFLLQYMMYLNHKEEKSRLLHYALILIMAGAIGNLIDRIARGYVIDFIQLEFIDFPVFNLADCYVNIGCFLLVLSCFIKKDEVDG